MVWNDTRIQGAQTLEGQESGSLLRKKPELESAAVCQAVKESTTAETETKGQGNENKKPRRRSESAALASRMSSLQPAVESSTSNAQ